MMVLFIVYELKGFLEFEHHEIFRRKLNFNFKKMFILCSKLKIYLFVFNEAFDIVGILNAIKDI